MSQEETHGTRIRRLRKAKGWTQEDLQELAGVDQSTLSGIEKNNAMPKWDTLGRIAQALGVTRNYLMEGKDAAWPFAVPMERFSALDAAGREYVEGALAEAIRAKEAKPETAPRMTRLSTVKAKGARRRTA